ncbi:GNAT family N-acetyltransferase [Marinobacterium sedimentorum]|uniref:GNAT family N-acetyltransferase n=1 Tax=Marinobacterium sedimentorum TaxID=2927804 RepID=UPI0020C70A5E|nr:GNAT family protein [Marinobacterium sedimentorum]MCP8686599.1 GNAT family N-acetyltransferase [Marinobacterium sedimentorum]
MTEQHKQGRLNPLGQPIGEPLSDWTAPAPPARTLLTGRFCQLEPLQSRHADDLFAANSQDTDGRSWTYMPYGPFASAADYRRWVEASSQGCDPQFYAIVQPSDGRALGVASYLRITPRSGAIEVGHIHYSAQLQRQSAATEAMYLLMRHAFELGYRRYEWKCDALNALSRAAAQRLGFAYEGTFRQATVYKGRNRDTAWYSVIDSEWPLLRRCFEQWLAPENFDAAGRQRHGLSELTRGFRAG